MRHLTYLGVLFACLVGTAPLEIVLRARVYRRWRRTVLALLPAVVVFTAWDIAAIRAGWWHFDRRYMSGVFLPGRLPLEELLFFVVVPVCAILTFETVCRLRPARPPDEEDHARTDRTVLAGPSERAFDGTLPGALDGTSEDRSDSTSDGSPDELTRP